VAAVIAGRAELLLSGAAGPLNDRQQRSLEILAHNAERLAQELDALAVLLDADLAPIRDTP
jgi:hypothetical protein